MNSVNGSSSRWLATRRHLQRLCEEVALGYSWVTLVPSWQAGLLLALMTFIDPVVAAIGLTGAVFAWYAGDIAGADGGERPVCVFNGLLSGLFVAHLWSPGISVVALAILGGVLAAWLTVVLGRLASSLLRMPILSLPFALVAMLTAAAGGSLSTLHFNPYVAPPEFFGNQLDKFLGALGNLYFLSNPLAGLLVLGVLLVFSRYYVFIALLGYAAAFFWFMLVGAAPEHLAATAWGSNAILAALLVGGLFATPSFMTAVLATLAAVMAAWLALAFGRILDVVHLLPFSIPFVMASWLVLYAAVHNARMAGRFNHLAPDFPERSYERAHIARARGGADGSVPLALPFTGDWTVSQGFAGAHTHRGPWRYALDFIVMKEGKSFAGLGERLEEFYCYDQPVLSPAFGQVWRVVNDIPDNPPGTVNTIANWGNCVVIRLYDGRFVMVAHLRPGSVAVAPGAWLKPGDLIGHCGNSGRSPQPHIHLHLQTGDDAVSPTVPFHLTNVLISGGGEAARYELAVVPQALDVLSNASIGDLRPFHLLAGRGMCYSVARDGGAATDWTLRCEVDERGRLILVSSAGGRCVAESTWAVFSCNDRDGKSDPYLDLWLLACGYTPVSTHVERWQNSVTPARLLPHRAAKWLALLAWPWAAFASSGYQRRWNEERQAWHQEGHHRHPISGIQIDTEAVIVPQSGCSYITGTMGASHYTMEATKIFQLADIGVPGWEVTLATTSSLAMLK